MPDDVGTGAEWGSDGVGMAVERRLGRGFLPLMARLGPGRRFSAQKRRFLERGYKRGYRKGLHFFERGVTKHGFWGYKWEGGENTTICKWKGKRAAIPPPQRPPHFENTPYYKNRKWREIRVWRRSGVMREGCTPGKRAYGGRRRVRRGDTLRGRADGWRSSARPRWAEQTDETPYPASAVAPVSAMEASFDKRIRSCAFCSLSRPISSACSRMMSRSTLPDSSFF